MAGNGLRAAGGVVKKTAKRAAGGGFSGVMHCLAKSKMLLDLQLRPARCASVQALSFTKTRDSIF